MIKNFLSLLESEKEDINKVLWPHSDPSILKYLIGGFFDEQKKRFMAYALMPVNKDYYWKYDYLLGFSQGYSVVFLGKKAISEINKS